MNAKWFCDSIVSGTLALSIVMVHSSAAVAQLVELGASSEVLEWTPLAPNESAVLAISDPHGEVRTRRFAPGSVPSLSLLATDGLPVPDGLYTWEIRMMARDASGKAKPLVESGHFRIAEGRLVPFDLEEPPEGGARTPASRELGSITAPDQMVPDDLIVDGKGCIGLGCVNSEGFGAEALRLKQALIRLRFEDTSGAGFASREWQLRINEPGASAVNLFAIEELDPQAPGGSRIPFTIEAGAPQNSLYIHSVGRIGVGTAVPATEVHVKSAGSPALRLEKSGSQAWDAVGDNTSFAIKDVTNAQTPLTIKPNAPTNRLVVTATGVGIDTALPGSNLHIFGSAGADVFNAVGPDPSIAGDALNFGYSGFTFGPGSGFFNVRPGGATAINPALYFATGNIDRMLIDNQGFLGVHLDGELGPGFNPAHPIHSQTTGAHLSIGGVWTNASSRDLKEEIAPLDAKAALAALTQLEPVNFRYKLEPSDPHVGFISEEVPELVANPDRKTLSPMDIVAVLTKVVQEQNRLLERERAARVSIEARLKSLEELAASSTRSQR